MATTAKVALEIAGTGHVYYAKPGAAIPDLSTFNFGDGSTLEGQGWTWLGDTSAKDMIEYDTDGGDTDTKNTWDRKGVKSTREAVTNTVTINALNLGEDTFKVAFPGSTYNADNGIWDLDLDATAEFAFLVVVEDTGQVSGYVYKRATVAGNLPALEDDEFTHVEMKLTLLAPTDGTKKVAFIEPRQATGKSTVKPTISDISPKGAAAKPGLQVTITGANFRGVKSVTFTAGGKAVKVAYSFVDDSHIKATLPSSIETGNVIVTNNIGPSDGFNYETAG